MHSDIFIQLAIILGLSSLFGMVTHKLKLPLVVAYLLAGVAIAVAKFFNYHESNALTLLPEIGIAFLLFLIGMELDLREIKSFGKPIIVASLLQILISSIAGFAIAGVLGFKYFEAIFLGIGLSFSSTIVVIKLLLEKRELSSLYGKLSIGILLVEDLVAIAVLMSMSVGSSVLNLGLQNSLPLLTLLLKTIVLFVTTLILSKYVLERLFDFVAKSTELLFLTAITWCFVFTSLALFAGFSVVIGAFLAGVSLASSPYHFHIQGKVKPLRDFFVVLFFVYLGAQVNLTDAVAAWPAVLIFTSYSILIKPTIFLLILGAFGFRKHTLFQTALTLSHISEFSLVILLLGVSNGLVGGTALSVMATVGVLSIIIASVLITYSRKVYKYVKPFIGFFEQEYYIHNLENSKSLKSDAPAELTDHVVIIGAHMLGGPVVHFLKEEKITFIVLEFNPHIIQELQKDGINAIYGDVSDPDILDNLFLESAKLIISTATDVDDNKVLLEEAKHRKSRAFLVARALDKNHAKILKDRGADYVIMPEQVSGDFLVEKIRHTWIKN